MACHGALSRASIPARVNASLVLVACCAGLPACPGSGQLPCSGMEDCCNQGYDEPRSRLEMDDAAWVGATLSVANACKSPECLEKTGLNCSYWGFRVWGPAGSECELTFSRPNGSQCHKILVARPRSEYCASLGEILLFSQLQGDDCSASDAATKD